MKKEEEPISNLNSITIRIFYDNRLQEHWWKDRKKRKLHMEIDRNREHTSLLRLDSIDDKMEVQELVNDHVESGRYTKGRMIEGRIYH